MTPPNGETILYRLLRANECLAEARLLAGEKHWNACVNRLYYACFYAVSGLLLTKDISTAKHSGVRSLFGRHFVKSEVISREDAAVFNELFERRQQSDYEDFFEASGEEVRASIPKVEVLVQAIERVIGDV